jgi:hypothetical protein
MNQRKVFEAYDIVIDLNRVDAIGALQRQPADPRAEVPEHCRFTVPIIMTSGVTTNLVMGILTAEQFNKADDGVEEVARSRRLAQDNRTTLVTIWKNCFR